MDVYTLSQQPLFTISLVISCLVAAYGFSTILKRCLLGLSKQAVESSSLDLLAIDLAGAFQNQIDALSDKIGRLQKLSTITPEPFKDRAWTDLQAILDDLKTYQGEMHRLLQNGEIEAGIRVAEILTGRDLKDIMSQSGGDLSDYHVDLIQRLKALRWSDKTREIMYRIVSRIEDHIREDKNWLKLELAIVLAEELADLKKTLDG
jgi:hypothetical protein